MNLKTSTMDLLAVEGGRPTREIPFAPWPSFGPSEIAATTKVLRSGKVNYWTGEQGRLFEREFAAFAGCKHAVAVASGTVALELALHALGITAGDEVIIPCRTFIASASCAVIRGAVPIVADVDAQSQNLTAETIRPLITSRTRAIIAVHLAGWPCDMDSILELAREYDLKVVEDCAQAHGATYKGRPVGSLGDAAAFSFCQDKIMTTGGEGGMLTTNIDSVWERAWSYRDHGTSYTAASNGRNSNGFRWIHESFGTNWRLSEMQSAIGRIQLRALPYWIEIRQRNARILTEKFSRSSALRVARPPDEIGHSYYKYYAFLCPGRLRERWNRDRVLKAINAEGIPCYSGICGEIYLEKAFPEKLRPAERMPAAQQLAETSLMFPVHPTLSERDMQDIAEGVEKVLTAATP